MLYKLLYVEYRVKKMYLLAVQETKGIDPVHRGHRSQPQLQQQRLPCSL